MARVAVAMLILLGLAIYSLSRLSTTPWSRPLSVPSLEISPGTAVPAFQHQANDKLFSPQALLGHWTLLTFWSHTCPPCLLEMPALNQLANNWNGPAFEVLTINVDQDENAELSKRFLEEERLSLPTIYDQQGQLQRAFGVDTFPRHFLINPEAKIVWTAAGAYQWNDNNAIDQLLRLMERPFPEPQEQTKEVDSAPDSEPEE